MNQESTSKSSSISRALNLCTAPQEIIFDLENKAVTLHDASLSIWYLVPSVRDEPFPSDDHFSNAHASSLSFT